MKHYGVFLIFVFLGFQVWSQNISDVRLIPDKNEFRVGEQVKIFWKFTAIPTSENVSILLLKKGNTIKMCEIANSISVAKGRTGYLWKVPSMCGTFRFISSGDLKASEFKIRVIWKRRSIRSESKYVKIKPGEGSPITRKSNRIIHIPKDLRNLTLPDLTIARVEYRTDSATGPVFYILVTNLNHRKAPIPPEKKFSFHVEFTQRGEEKVYKRLDFKVCVDGGGDFGAVNCNRLLELSSKGYAWFLIPFDIRMPADPLDKTEPPDPLGKFVVDSENIIREANEGNNVKMWERK